MAKASSPGTRRKSRSRPAALPRWDAVGRLLWFGRRLVKRFVVPATNQDVVLAAFQDAGWPEVIDDPLPRTPGIDARVRLHNTIKHLNHCHECRLIRFGGSCDGRGVRWRRVATRRDAR